MIYTENEILSYLKGSLLMAFLFLCTFSFSQNDSPISGRKLVKPDPDGTFFLTAETGEGMGPGIKYMPEWRAYGWFTAEDWIEWKVNVIYGGEYEVYMEWSVSDEEAGKEFLLELKGDSLSGMVNKSGSWETYKIQSIGTVRLEEGIQDVVFRPKKRFPGEALLDLRFLRFLPVR